jgi:uncharacterized protein YndB with AHSA1/START domain
MSNLSSRALPFQEYPLRWILIILGILVFILVAIALAGAMLPQEHTVTRSIVLKQTPEAVWATVTDHANEPKWRSDVESITRLADRNGHPLVEEKYKNGDTLKIETVEAHPPTRLVRDVVDNPIFSGRWTYELKPEAGGTRVSITEHGSVPNPVFRLISRFVIGHTTSLDRFLTALAGKFGETAEIR